MNKPLAVLIAAAVLVGPPGLLLAVAVLGTGAAACPVPSQSSSSSPATIADETGQPAGTVPETTTVVMPLPTGTYTVSDSYGWRTDPFTGARAFHAGTDFPAPAGTQVLAIADGVVLVVGHMPGGWGNYIVINHTVDDQGVASLYGHLLDQSTHVTVGQSVNGGDWIADVGSTGRSTGPHLHLEIRPGGWGQPTVDPVSWLSGHGAEGAGPAGSPAGCAPASTP